MPKKRRENNNLEEDEAKIFYSDNKPVCFACGEQIERKTEICPYCKTIVG
ncbi:MAG: hypothetical protein ACW986_05280 [Promethearchaeota archaeon]|jgi:predicted amidophosphoribosyltransferase